MVLGRQSPCYKGYKMELEKVTRYYPDEMPLGGDVQYFVDKNGRDWYESLKYFTKPYVISYDPSTGIIHSSSTDASAIYPAGLNVIDIESLPEGFDIIDGWIYVNGVVSENYSLKAESYRQGLVLEASELITDWLIDLQLGVISDEDKESLIIWRQYMKKLTSLDLTGVTSKDDFNQIEWPPKL